MLSVWWDVHGVVYWQLLPTNTTVTAEVYCAQLENLMANLKAKRPQHDKIYFLIDNARPYVAKLVYNKLMEYGWELLPHPPYSPDLAPTDYHLFQSLSNSLREKMFVEESELEEYLATFFKLNPKEFYAKGIMTFCLDVGERS
jgi:histone-lysine N-methyltransferase SETMAR